MSEKNPSCFNHLNPVQMEAVLYDSSHLLILAGAGSGKTRVITSKIAYLIAEKGVDPQSILAVTFTNKAANEMHKRVVDMVPQASEVMIRTFHSFGAWLLRRNVHLLNMERNFSIYDDEDSLSLIRSLYKNRKRSELAKYSKLTSRAKDYCIGPEGDFGKFTTDPEFPAIYASYEKRLREIGNADFGDLIMRVVELLRENPEVRTRIQQRFQIILVDEYQDSNIAQFELLKLLTGSNNRICVVGDDDQSIYRFRGAEVKNILTFPDRFPGTKVIKLEQNYRSTEQILSIASAVMKNNQERLGKTLWTEKTGGKKAVLTFLENHKEEAEYCAGLLKEGNPEETAILYRTNAQSAGFETCFLRRGIPYRIVGSLRFYEREEVKDTIAFFTFMSNSKDEIAFRRIINKPARGVGKKSADRIIEISGETGGDLIKAMQQSRELVSSKAKEGVSFFLTLVESLNRILAGSSLSDFVKSVIEKSGLFNYYKQMDEIAFTQKVGNLDEMVNTSANYPCGMDGLAKFLEDIQLNRSKIEGNAETGDKGVTLITMHNTKGLEFDRVIITGLEQGLFPGAGDEDDEKIEEERRLFYVSITRAKKELYLTSCRNRMIWGRMVSFSPSVFLEEIPKEYLETEPGTGKDKNDYSIGMKVYHDDYGTGIISKSWYNGSEFVVMVRFETGRIAKFIPEYTPLERISTDD